MFAFSAWFKHIYAVHKQLYSGTSVVEHNSFLKPVRKPICLKTEAIFP
jgi:hypothetical protein